MLTFKALWVGVLWWKIFQGWREWLVSSLLGRKQCDLRWQKGAEIQGVCRCWEEDCSQYSKWKHMQLCHLYLVSKDILLNICFCRFLRQYLFILPTVNRCCRHTHLIDGVVCKYVCFSAYWSLKQTEKQGTGRETVCLFLLLYLHSFSCLISVWGNCVVDCIIASIAIRS